jgi:probable rRNA maturation factor
MPLAFLASPANQALIGAEALATIAQCYGERFSGQELEVELECLDLDGIRELNLSYRELDEPTDVLSFPIFVDEAEIAAQPAGSPVLVGGIAVCPEKAVIYKETLPQLVHHGLLHLLGYDHEEDMSAWQEVESGILARMKELGIIIPSMTTDEQAV